MIGIGIEFGNYSGWDAVMVTQNFATTDALVPHVAKYALENIAPPRSLPPDFLCLFYAKWTTRIQGGPHGHLRI